jgi:hypothetical protein
MSPRNLLEIRGPLQARWDNLPVPSFHQGNRTLAAAFNYRSVHNGLSKQSSSPPLAQGAASRPGWAAAELNIVPPFLLLFVACVFPGGRRA